MYEIQSNDDYEAFAELEQTGILNQTDDARKYYHGHDAFEELAVNHTFTEQYKKKEYYRIWFELCCLAC